jgi:hypothetical protein
MPSFRFVVAFALSGALLASLVGCPASEDDGLLCNDSKCGPGVCLQFCGADAAKEGAAAETGSDAATDVANDAANDGGQIDAATDAPTDGTDGG